MVSMIHTNNYASIEHRRCLLSHVKGGEKGSSNEVACPILIDHSSLSAAKLILELNSRCLYA